MARGRSVRSVNPDDRPREKLGRLGAGALGDNELLAVILGTGTASIDVLSLADVLLASVGGLHGLVRATRDDLLKTSGLGQARAAQVMAAVEIGRRVLSRRPGERVRIASPREAAAVLMPEFGLRSVEQFGVLLLDVRHRVLRTQVIAVGTLDSTTVQPRDVFRLALVSSASAVVMFHNHPSGDPQPSREDLDLTRRLIASGDLIGVAVVDHIVLGDGRYYSMKEAGLF
jgi:DNA repair protein RadC